MITIIHRIESLNILAFHFSDSFTIKEVNISPSDLLILSYCFSHFLAASLNCCLMYGPTSVLCRIITNARIIKATSGWQATQKKDNESWMRVSTPGIPVWHAEWNGRQVGGLGWWGGAVVRARDER